jgi:phosphate transport system substrate-binding protein
MFKLSRSMAFAVIALSTLLSACGTAATAAPTDAMPAATQDSSSSVVVNTPAPALGGNAGSSSVTINGAGATFPFPLYSRWFYDYAFVDPSVKFNYQAIGSGGGIKQITAKTVDFGASDAILSSDQLTAAPGIQMFPSVAGAEVLAYNLAGADGQPITATLKFPYTAVADMYLGKIKKWNDPVLAAANPDVKLPDKDIILVHRSDGSGTTYIFTDYLSKVSPDWKAQVGNATSVQWPAGLGGKGNDGVAGTVSQNDGAVGYVELAYALTNKLAYGIPQNKAGQYTDPKDPTVVQNAMADFGSDLGDKLAISIVDAPGQQSYPISGYTYLLFYMDQQDCSKAQKLVAFYKWAQSDGQKDATDLNYIALPDAVKSQALDKLSKMTCQGKPIGG